MKKRAMQVTLLLCLVSQFGFADSIPGRFIDQPVVFQGCMQCGFFPPGTIEQGTNGFRSILLENWTAIPFDAQWVTKANPFTLDSDTHLLIGYETLPVQISLVGNQVFVKYQGYVIGNGTLSQSITIPEPGSMALMIIGVGTWAGWRKWHMG